MAKAARWMSRKTGGGTRFAKSPMGMAVETSTCLGLWRRNAALVTGPAHDEARQDEDHAGDTDQMGQVLDSEVVGVVVRRMREPEPVDDDVESAASGHHGEAEQHQDGESAREPERLYHQHTLEIYPSTARCQVYSQ